MAASKDDMPGDTENFEPTRDNTSDEHSDAAEQSHVTARDAVPDVRVTRPHTEDPPAPRRLRPIDNNLVKRIPTVAATAAPRSNGTFAPNGACASPTCPRKKPDHEPDPPRSVSMEPPVPLTDAQRKALPHMALARSQLGTKEAPGDDNDNPDVVKYYSATDLGKAHDSVPWCAAFVGYCLKESGTPNSGGANARSYMQWGKATKKPRYGDIVVFWRGSKAGWLGHVAFFVSDDGDQVKVLGGNQHDCVCYASYPKSKVLGYRTMSTFSNSKTIKAVAAASLLTAGAAFTQQSQYNALWNGTIPNIALPNIPEGTITPESAAQVASWAAMLPGRFGMIMSAVSQLMLLYIAYERLKKQQNVGV
jgi:uncharacterized protein (TIGR02594 family)